MTTTIHHPVPRLVVETRAKRHGHGTRPRGPQTHATPRAWIGGILLAAHHHHQPNVASKARNHKPPTATQQMKHHPMNVTHRRIDAESSTTRCS